MTDTQFQIAKVWDKDKMCFREKQCFLYVYGRYWISVDPRMSVLALNREIELLYRRASRLQRSAIDPLVEVGHETPQLRVAHTALAGMIEAAGPLRHAGFSAEVAARDESEAG